MHQQPNIIPLPTAAASPVHQRIEDLLCDLQSILTLQDAVVDGDRHTCAREWLNRQQERHLLALEQLVNPQG